jgi:hypothetical protein
LEQITTVSKAILLLHERVVLARDVFAEIRIWLVPQSVPGSTHDLKYSLALVAARRCVLRYDNESGKGDHRHAEDGGEAAYAFRNADTLIADFWKEVDAWLERNRS